MGQPSPAHVDLYQPGDMVTLRATFVSTDLVTPADPSHVYFELRDPWGALASFPYGVAAASVVRVGVGAYVHDHQTPRAASAAGDWFYAGVGTGLLQAAEEWTFRVASSGIL